jgi:hypothetical protein
VHVTSPAYLFPPSEHVLYAPEPLHGRQRALQSCQVCPFALPVNGADLAMTRDLIAEIPYLVALSTYLSWTILFVVGHIRDVLAKLFWGGTHPAAKAAPGYAELRQDYEDFYTRRAYYRVIDCFERPVVSAPGRTLTIKMRSSKPGQQQAPQLTGETRTVINLGSYNYLGFASQVCVARCAGCTCACQVAGEGLLAPPFKLVHTKRSDGRAQVQGMLQHRGVTARALHASAPYRMCAAHCKHDRQVTSARRPSFLQRVRSFPQRISPQAAKLGSAANHRRSARPCTCRRKACKMASAF